MEAHRQRVGARIRQARKAAGLSHDALAATVGTSRQHLIKLEQGRHLPRPDMLAAIADATGKPEQWFDQEDEEERTALTIDQILLELAVANVTTQKLLAEMVADRRAS